MELNFKVGDRVTWGHGIASYVVEYIGDSLIFFEKGSGRYYPSGEKFPVEYGEKSACVHEGSDFRVVEEGSKTEEIPQQENPYVVKEYNLVVGCHKHFCLYEDGSVSFDSVCLDDLDSLIEELSKLRDAHNIVQNQ